MGTENNTFPPVEGDFVTKVTNYYPPSYSETSQPVVLGTGSQSRVSVKTPGFRQKVKKSGLDLPMNPFSFGLERKGFPYGSLVTILSNTNDGIVKIEEQVGPWNIGVRSVSSVFPASLDARARSGLLRKAKAQSVNLAVATAEGRKTFKMFFDTAKKFVGAANSLKHGDFYGAAAALGLGESVRIPSQKRQHYFRPTKKDVASKWLELQYGWKPLLSDLYGAAEFLANTLERSPRTKISFRASLDDNEDFGSVETEPWYRHDSITRRYEVTYIVYFREDIYGGSLPTALGLTNPAAVAWELVPFSFVADWFIPIGSFLDTLDASNGKEFVKGCKVEFFRGNSTRSQTAFTTTDGFNTRQRSGYLKQTLDVITCTRTPLGGFPGPGLPSFNSSPLNPLRTANAAALLTQLKRSFS